MGMCVRMCVWELALKPQKGKGVTTLALRKRVSLGSKRFPGWRQRDELMVTSLVTLRFPYWTWWGTLDTSPLQVLLDRCPKLLPLVWNGPGHCQLARMRKGTSCPPLPLVRPVGAPTG